MKSVIDYIHNVNDNYNLAFNNCHDFCKGLDKYIVSQVYELQEVRFHKELFKDKKTYHNVTRIAPNIDIQFSAGPPPKEDSFLKYQPTRQGCTRKSNIGLGGCMIL